MWHFTVRLILSKSKVKIFLQCICFKFKATPHVCEKPDVSRYPNMIWQILVMSQNTWLCQSSIASFNGVEVRWLWSEVWRSSSRKVLRCVWANLSAAVKILLHNDQTRGWSKSLKNGVVLLFCQGGVNSVQVYNSRVGKTPRLMWQCKDFQCGLKSFCPNYTPVFFVC